MRKLTGIVLVATFVAVLSEVVRVASKAGPPNPVYKGHRLSYWVDGVPANGYASKWDFSKAAEIDSVIDSNALPYLVQLLKRRDGLARRLYVDLWVHFPGWLKTRTGTPGSTELGKQEACELLQVLGAQARPAIPELIRLVREDDSAGVRCWAAIVLGRIANRDDPSVVETLVLAATDRDPMVCANAMGALKNIDPDAAAKATAANTATSPH